ncbi:MAG TPA: hypothetical protein VGH49_10540 [Xanthobacteraceae bacterium]|jgi:hypothetical protein
MRIPTSKAHRDYIAEVFAPAAPAALEIRKPAKVAPPAWVPPHVVDRWAVARQVLQCYWEDLAPFVEMLLSFVRGAAAKLGA